MDKVLKLNSWSWIALLGYVELVITLLFLFCIYSGELLHTAYLFFITVWLFIPLFRIIVFISPLFILIAELITKLCGFNIKRIINNKIAVIIGLIVNIGMICLYAYMH